ncbi:MAG TPA: hypothetical protein VHV53_08945 [Solirubrobacterales bacterium]|nr:hypothetical protein [Solirubrobacterales bacterium]
MNKRIVVSLLLVALAALALAACGGGGSGDEDKIAETIETAATTADPSNCTELQTRRFDEQNSATKGAGAVKACEEEAESGSEEAEAVNVSNVSIDAEKATAEVEFEGGALNSQTLELALVQEGGDWKLDQIEGFASYDGKALAAAFEKQYEEDSQGLNEEQIGCIAEGIGAANQAEAEGLFFSGSPEKLEELARGCA